MNPSDYDIAGEFLEHQGRKLFCLMLEPTSVEAHSTILFLAPFAEEMNKSRRIVSRQARELAAAGNRVMLLDLTGCGDAGGDFLDASWQIWFEDAMFAADSLANPSVGPLKIWGLRLGALLACAMSQARSDVHSLVLWQPVLNGEQQIDQFLRLRTVAAAVTRVPTFDRKALWNELRAGRSLDIAGYELSSAMALELAQARLNDLGPKCPVHWLEIGVSGDGNFPVASESVMAHWKEQGIAIDARYVKGDPFWRTIDAEINLTLLQITTEVFAQT